MTVDGPPLTREQVRDVDRRAIDELAIPGIVLMENAGRNATDAMLHWLDADGSRLGTLTPAASSSAMSTRFVVVCGGGNNGGDGYVIARHLHNAGVDAIAVAYKKPASLTGDALINATIAQRMDLVRDWSPELLDDQSDSSSVESLVIVDALLGTGFRGRVRDGLGAVIADMNRCRADRENVRVVSIDVPSGMDCDTGGVADGVAVRADLTVTFVAAKVGFQQAKASDWLGDVVVADIGVPPSLVARVRAEMPG